MPGGREAGHIGADLGDQVLRGDDADAGDLVELGHLGGAGGQSLPDPGGEGGDLGGDRVDPVQHHARQEGVVIGEVPGQGLLKHAVLSAHAAAGQLRQRAGVTLPADQGVEHGAAGGAEDVADHR